MKKQFLSLLVAFTFAVSTLFCGSIAFAAVGTEVNVKADYYNRLIRIDGSVGTGVLSNGTVSLIVLRSGVDFDSLNSMSDAQKESAVIYASMFDAKENDGRFSFAVGYDKSDLADAAALNISNARIVADGGALSKDFTITLVDQSAYTTAVSYVNYYAIDNTKSDEEFAEYVRNNMAILGFDPAPLAESEINGSNLSAYRSYIASNLIDAAKPDDAYSKFKTFALISALKAGKVSGINRYCDYVFADDVLEEKYISVAENDDIDMYFTGKLAQSVKSNSTADLERFEKDLKTAYILTAARYGSGYGVLKEAVNLYGDVLGLTASTDDSVYRTLIGNDYTPDTFKSAYANAVSADKGSFGGSGSSGGKKNSIGSGSITMTPSVSANVPLTRNFMDIDGVAWASGAILALADKNIVNGKEEGLFKPFDEVTREEFVKILLGAMNMGGYSYSNHFNDVSSGAWYEKWVNIAYEQNLCRGIGNDKFGIGSAVTRQDMAVLVYNALKSRGFAFGNASELNFDDASLIQDYAKEAVANLVSIGAMNGTSDTAFEPDGVATRAQAATVIYRILSKLQ